MYFKNCILLIDLGSNSTIFTVLYENNSKTEILYETSVTGRISELLSHNNSITEEILNRNINIINSSINNISGKFEFPKILGMATHALRTASNGENIIDIIKEKTKIHFEIISGQEEALYTFKACKNIIEENRFNNTLISDIGGGSSEIVISCKTELKYKYSFPIGAVNIENIYKVSSGLKKNTDSARKNIQQYFSNIAIREKTDNLILCGGTATTIAAMLNNLSHYNPALIEGIKVSAKQIKELNKEILNMSNEKKSEFFALSEKRAEIINAGILLTLEICNLINPENIIITTMGPRHGYYLKTASVNQNKYFIYNIQDV